MVYEKRYENGLRLVVKQMEGLLSVSTGILVGTGGAFETDEEDGISHFIEHMQFKGTKTRSAFELSDAFDQIGAQVNAFTGKDCTCYYAKSSSDHTGEAFELLADLFLNASYPDDETEREKGVICEEISMNEDTPDELCFDVLSAALYGKENYGRNILGNACNVRSFTKEKVDAYKAETYLPENIVISFAGGVDFKTAEALTDRFFSDMKRGNFIPRKKEICMRSESLICKKPVEQMHLAIGYKAIEREHPLSAALQTANSIFGGGMSSRLFQEVREKLGLAYSVYSYVSSFSECGSLVVYAGVNPANAKKAYAAIDKITKELVKNGVSEDEFLRGREQMKSSMLFSQESTAAQMLLYGKYMLFNDKTFDFDLNLKEINDVTRADANEALRTTFLSGVKSVGAVGNSDVPFSL